MIDRIDQRTAHESSVHQHLLSTYVELRRVAGALMRGERVNHTLQPTALVHEAILRILRRESTTFNDEIHFLHTAVREMRRVLIDSARKRDGIDWQHLSQHLLNGNRQAPPVDRLDLLALDEAITKLEQLDARQAQIAEFRIFFGLTNAEIATLLSISQRTVERKWAVARSRIAIDIDRDRHTRGGGDHARP